MIREQFTPRFSENDYSGGIRDGVIRTLGPGGSTTFAGALGIRLGGRNVYHGRAEERGVLGNGHAVLTGDLARSNRLAAAVSVVALAFAMIIRAARR